jgi:L-ascorbate metabolism protein UlaG (beta-lactamase superfamily)
LSDAAAARELEAAPLPLPPGLEIEWLGVSGYRLTFESVSIFIDPFVSRPPLRNLLLRRTSLPDAATIGRYVKAPGPVAGVLVGHTHWDHALDAPAIAEKFDTKAYGSDSLVRLMGLHELADRAVEVDPGKPLELGPFVVTFVPSFHSKLILGRKVPFDGPLTCDDVDSLSPSAYKCGQVWGIHIEVAGTTLHHQGSCNLDDDALGKRPVDIFLAGVAGRTVTPRYWERILSRLDPEVVVPTHYDDLFTPLGRERKFVRGAELEQLPEEIRAVSRDARLAALPRIDA